MSTVIQNKLINNKKTLQKRQEDNGKNGEDN